MNAYRETSDIAELLKLRLIFIKENTVQAGSSVSSRGGFFAPSREIIMGVTSAISLR